MSDEGLQPWTGRIAAGETLTLELDRDKLRATLGRNTVYVAVYGFLVVIVVAAIVALAVTGVGRYLTYALLAILLIVLTASLGMGLWLRRRVQGFLSLADPFLAVGREGIAFTGVPRIGWGDVLGVIYGDSSENLRTGNVVGRWMKGLTYRAGGAQVFLNVGIDRPKRYRAAASGELARYISASMDLGGILVHLDTALNDVQLARLREALRAATAFADAPYLETSDTARIARAASSMATGRRMRRDA